MKKIVLITGLLLSGFGFSQGKDIVHVKKSGGLFGLYRNVESTPGGCVDNCGSTGGQSQSFDLSCSGIGTNRCKLGTVNGQGGGLDNGAYQTILEVQEKMLLMMDDIDSDIERGQKKGTQGAKVLLMRDGESSRTIVIRAQWTHEKELDETNIRFEVQEVGNLN